MSARAGVIFDFDGVIVDSEPLQYRSYAQALAPYGVEISAGEYEREWIAAGRGPEYVVDRYALSITPDELRRVKEPIYAEMLRGEAQLMPGISEALARLGAEFPLAVATNSVAAEAGFVLDTFDLRKHFAAVVTREDYSGRKPLPDAFVTATQRLDLAPARCVVIEDAYKGVLAAERAGCPCVAIPHDFTRSNDFTRATVVLESLHDVTTGLIWELVGGGRREGDDE